MQGMGGMGVVAPPHGTSQTIIVNDEGSDSESEHEAVPMQRDLRQFDDLLSSSSVLIDQARNMAPASQDISTDNLRAVVSAKQRQMEMMKEKSQLAEQLARSEAGLGPVRASQQATPSSSQYLDTLQPQKARRPQATETNTAHGVTKAAKSQRQQRKRKDVDIPDIDLSDIGSFNVVPASQKFRSWLTKCLKNGNQSFTKGDAAQLASYAAKHSEQYFALKDGWVRTLKGLTEQGEVLKAWYAYDCLLNMKEFSREAVRATWVVKLPDLIADYMDFNGTDGLGEKYTKLLATWRGRVDIETMSSVTKKLASRGVVLKDALPAPAAFTYNEGSTVEFFSERISEWVPSTITTVNQKAKTVTIKPSAPGLPSSSISFSQALSVLRKPRQRGAHEPKRRKHNGDSPKF